MFVNPTSYFAHFPETIIGLQMIQRDEYFGRHVPATSHVFGEKSRLIRGWRSSLLLFGSRNNEHFGRGEPVVGEQ